MAVKMDGRPDEVIGLPDLLSFGPIDYTDPETRGAWVEQIRRSWQRNRCPAL